MLTQGLYERRILVVEDEPYVAMMIQDVLAEHGCAVEGPVSKVSDALAIANSKLLHGAVLDINLGNEDTYIIASHLRQNAVPFMFATGYGGEGVRADFLSELTLSKPFSEVELVKALDKLMQKME
jgi:CheY-like chemotaxis protein